VHGDTRGDGHRREGGGRADAGVSPVEAVAAHLDHDRPGVLRLRGPGAVGGGRSHDHSDQ
jgi:hypothetical protein